MDISDQNRILESVKESITETTQKTEESASYFIVGLAAAIVIAVIVVLAAVSSKNAQVATYDEQIKTDVTNQLASLEKEQEQISSVFTQLDTLDASLSKRIKYSQLFVDLTKNQYQKSKWTAVTVQGDSISITGETGSFEDVARTVVALKSLTSVKTIKLSSATLSQEKQVIAFVVDIKVDLKGYKNPIAKASPTSTASVEVPL